MIGRLRAASIVAIGILLAGALVAGVTLFQRDYLSTTTIQSSSSTPSLTTQTSMSTSQTESSSSSPSNVETSSSLSSSTVVSSQSQPGSGYLVLQIHDPPNVPPGVTSVFVTYSDIFLGQSTGTVWVDLKQSGTIDLMTVVNFTQTIANVNVPSGTFDLMVMNISSVVLTSNSVNYTASLPDNQLSIPILGGGLVVSNSTMSGAVIDVSPTVIEHTVYNSTGGSEVSFLITPSANAFVIPSDQFSQNTSHVGEREDINNEQWLSNWISRQQNQMSFDVASAALTNSSFILVLKNTGNTSVLVQTVFIEANSTHHSGGEDGRNDLNLGRSILFAVLANGTLVPRYFGGDSDYHRTLDIGYNLSAHTQVILSYLGPVPPNLHFGNSGDDDNSTTTIWQTVSDYNNGDLPRATNSTSDNQQAGQAVQFSGQNWFGFVVIPGQNYLVGATSGSVTTTLVVTAG